MEIGEELLGRCTPREAPRIGCDLIPVQLHGLQTRGSQVLVQRSCFRVVDDVDRSRDGVRRDRQATRHGLEQHQAEGVGPAWKDEHIGRGIDFR